MVQLRVKTLHRNHLHPVNFLDDTEMELEEYRTIDDYKEPEKIIDASGKRENDVTSYESDDEDDGCFLIPETRQYADAHKSNIISSETEVKEKISTQITTETTDIGDKGNKGTDPTKVSAVREMLENKETNAYQNGGDADR